ncbi:MAG: asparagine synthase (glutamine-hydrolyzing) [Candidatus Sericytochromatia bacterium]
MCGITGFLSLDGAPATDERALDAMCRVMTHRGPDEQGTTLTGPVALGMRRLSIIDLAGGQQPISNEDGAVTVVFNGEIYNYPELRDRLLARGHRFATQSDTEVIVHLYEDHGEDFLKHLNGMFAIALWDARDRKLILARDRMGETPLYSTTAGRTLLWGSEIKCLLAHPALDRRLSLPALSRYLQFDYVPAPHAILEGLHKLPQAHMLVVEDGEVEVKPYWRLDLTARTPAPSEAEALEELDRRLLEAVERRLLAEVPLGVFLSGGIDSSTIAALAARVAPGRLKTFSIGFDDPSFDESRHARHVAEHLGTDHHEETLSAEGLLALVPRLSELLDEPFGDASVMPTYLLSRFARRHVTVALGGDGGDELFAGYPTYQAQRLAGLYDRLPGAMRGLIAPAGRAMAGALPVNTNNLSLDFKLKRFTGALDQPLLERHSQWLGSFTPAEQATLLTPEAMAAIRGDDLYDQARAYWTASADWDAIARYLHLDASTYLPDDILFKVDRASMAASLEVRAPFLDHTLVEFIAGLPSDYKLRGWTTKHLLKRVARRYLPEAIVDRPKKGFGIPVAKWFKGELKSTMLDVFAPERLRAAGLFQVDAVEKLIRDHLDGVKDNRKPLWTLFMFELWREAYMGARPTPSAR